MITDFVPVASGKIPLPPIAPPDNPTWNDLVAIEPRLKPLAAYAATSRWSVSRYESLKRRVGRLVGWHSRNPRLSSSRCYEIAVWYLAGLLRSRRRFLR
ncbi:hypothetical protein [Rhodopirellula sp. SWK7]|uniref:hypothetical protein n=1 Tax=Rhodopirellula sp. SWK7 TaxID=595460 RepID=UPI0002BD58F5|nr:hypothetical protein [Rhodopirellula sp. SWK7]EMI40532.1 hypothetical protein RRSWK_06941 [Rhodopirellula sp. SWK7]